MPLNNKKYTIDQLAEFTSNGFSAASFPQIRDAIAREMMKIYGNDIDISSASADGQYINMEALIINNIYRVLENIQKALNPATATGHKLDILCGLSNVYRQYPTYSTCYLYVKNNSSVSWNDRSITCVDKNGETWIWYNAINFDRDLSPKLTIEPGQIVSLEFTCNSTLGAVTAYRDQNNANSTLEDTYQDILDNPENYGTTSSEITDITAAENYFWNVYINNNSGDIYQTIDTTNFLIYQLQDATPGKTEENDAQLKNKKLRLQNSLASTTLESLQSNLLKISGILDCYVYSNITTPDSVTLSDKAVVKLHDCYIVLRYDSSLADANESNTVVDYDITQTIYKTLTPGVCTTNVDGSAGLSGGKMITGTIDVLEGQTVTFYWKKAEPVKPKITLNLTLLSTTDLTGGYDGSGTTSSNNISTQTGLIKNQLRSYLNNVRIGESISITQLLNILLRCDLKTSGYNTYLPTSGHFGEVNTDVTYIAPLTYFNYSLSDIKITKSGTTITITIGEQ